jgi:aconitate hydratase
LKSWKNLPPGKKEAYHKVITLDLRDIQPLVAAPHSPDNVKTMVEVEGIPVNQVCIGSCTNSSYRDLMTAAAILKGKRIHPGVGLSLASLIDAGARILENACGPCIGMGFSPPSAGVSLRTFNRNFKGRSGTKDADVYLVSPAVAAASALTGEITDPRTLGKEPQIRAPRVYPINDNMIIPPAKKGKDQEIVRGPNIKPLPKGQALGRKITGEVLLKVGDNITTDHIMPAGAKILPLRSNIPAISEHVFETVDPSFPQRARQAGTGFVVGGNNYGQGSSREHAALAPMHLGVRAVITKSFARIHQANLVNFGIVPLVFANEEDYDRIEQGDKVTLDLSRLEKGATLIKGREKIPLTHELGERDLTVIRAGGSLLYARKTG